MQLLPINSNVLVNVEKISSIEAKSVSGKKTVVVNVEGKSYILERDLATFLKDLQKAGVDMQEQFWSI